MFFKVIYVWVSTNAHRSFIDREIKKIRRDRAKQLLQRFKNNTQRNIVFTDKKIFSVEESFNKQTDCVYAQSSEDARNKFSRVQRGHHPESVMIWWGISYNHVTSIHFCEKGVETSNTVY